jgi:hypothetical protein
VPAPVPAPDSEPEIIEDPPAKPAAPPRPAAHG